MNKKLVVGLLVIGLTGCGELSRKDLAAKAGKICTTAAKKSATKQPETIQELQKLAKQNVAATGAEIKQLTELKPPKELKGKYKAFLASLRQKKDLTDKLGKAAAANDMPKIQQLGAESDKGRAHYQDLTSNLGFKDCEPS